MILWELPFLRQFFYAVLMFLLSSSMNCWNTKIIGLADNPPRLKNPPKSLSLRCYIYSFANGWNSGLKLLVAGAVSCADYDFITGFRDIVRHVEFKRFRFIAADCFICNLNPVFLVFDGNAIKDERHEPDSGVFACHFELCACNADAWSKVQLES